MMLSIDLRKWRSVEREGHLHPLLIQAAWACELLHYQLDIDLVIKSFGHILDLKARIHASFGQHTVAIAAFRQADEHLGAAERKGSAVDHGEWRDIIIHAGTVYLDSHQLEAAKCCFLKVLAWPRQSLNCRINALNGMALYWKERSDWTKTIGCGAQGLKIIREAKEQSPMGNMEERFLLLLADAAEGQGGMIRAVEYDLEMYKLWVGSGKSMFGEMVASLCRQALNFLDAGRPREAVLTLQKAPDHYVELLQWTGINLLEWHEILPVMAALKVLAEALEQTQVVSNANYAKLIRADVEETEAILRGFWEGVLEETRWELGEQRRAAAAAAALAGAAALRTMEEEAAAAKMSKAAKRKQQKRKAQQQKTMAGVAAAVAAATVVTLGEEGYERARGGREARTGGTRAGERGTRGGEGRGRR